ncbi:MAG: NAD(P)H-dependent oxidoreductase [Phycisphaerales bacterium]
MLRLTDRSNPAALVLSASPSCVSRASVLAGCAIVSLGDRHMPVQRVELARISPAALYEGVPSDKLDAALAAAESVDLIVLVAPMAGTAFSGLLPAFLDRMPEGALAGKVIVPLLTGGDPAGLARFEASLRSRLESLGATVALGDLFDATDDLEGSDAGRRIDGRIDRAVEEGVLAFDNAVVTEQTETAPLEESEQSVVGVGDTVRRVLEALTGVPQTARLIAC